MINAFINNLCNFTVVLFVLIYVRSAWSLASDLVEVLFLDDNSIKYNLILIRVITFILSSSFLAAILTFCRSLQLPCASILTFCGDCV